MPGIIGIRLGAIVAAGVSAGVLAIVGSTVAQAETIGQWTVANPPQSTVNDQLTAVASINATDAWAVGDSYDGDTSSTVATRWDGKRWLAAESVGEGALRGVAASGANDVWAVGTHNSSLAILAAHWNGSSWQVVPTPTPGPVTFPEQAGLNSVAAVGHNDVWAVGCVDGSAENSLPSVPLAQHWDGHTWTEAALPAIPGQPLGGCLTSVTAVSSNNVWATGTSRLSSSSNDLTMHWDGKKWSIMPVISAGGTHYFANQVISVGTDVWAIGIRYVPSSLGWNGLALHWTGSTWQPTVLPANITLNSVTPDGNGGLLAAGNTASGSGCVVMHESGGTWTQAATPAATCGSISGLARTPGTNTVLAVGNTEYDGSATHSFAAISTPWK